MHVCVYMSMSVCRRDVTGEARCLVRIGMCVYVCERESSNIYACVRVWGEYFSVCVCVCVCKREFSCIFKHILNALASRLQSMCTHACLQYIRACIH